MPEGMAGQSRPADCILAFLDPLLCRTAAVVELDHPPVGPAPVGHDEADAGVELTLMPLYFSHRGNFSHRGTGSNPALGLVAEAGERHDGLLRRAADRPGQQVPDPRPQHLVGLPNAASARK
jgi:hypothetical protein